MYGHVFGAKTGRPSSSNHLSIASSIVAPELHIHLYTCFVISKFLLPYLNFAEGSSTVCRLISDTVLFRHYLASELTANSCRHTLIKIKNNTKFSKKNLGTNSGIFSLF